MSVPPSQPRRWFAAYRDLDRAVWVLAAARGVNTMGLSLVMAFMAIYMVAERGLPASVYGGIFLVANLCQSLSQAYAGELCDKLGRRRMMRAALFGRAAVIALLGTLIIFEVSVWLIAPVLVLSSVLRGLFEPVAYAVVADVVKPDQRVPAFGLQRMGTNLGWAMGPALGGALALFMDYGAIFYCSVPTLLIAGWAASTVADRERDDDEDVEVSVVTALRIAGQRSDVIVLLGCSFLAALVHVQLFSTLSIYNETVIGMTKADIGLLYTLNGLLVLTLQVPSIAFIQRLGHHRALILGAVIYSVAFGAVAVATGWGGIAMAVAILTLGEVTLAPSQQAMIAEISDPRRMGRAYGLFGLLQMIGTALAPFIGGIAYDTLRHDGRLMWGALAALPVTLAIGYVIFGVLRARRER